MKDTKDTLDLNTISLNCTDSYPGDWEMPAMATNVEHTELKTFSRRSSMPRIKHQGSVGSCVGQACSGMLSDTAAFSDKDFSAMWVYKQAKKVDQWPGEDYSGTSISGALYAMRKVGTCEEAFYPYDRKTEDYDSEEGSLENAGHHRILNSYQIPFDRTRDIKQVLSDRSLPFSMAIREDFFTIGVDGILDDLDMYLDSEYAGGHAMRIIGWTHIDDILFWEVRNSWGTGWGDDGYGFIEHDLLLHVASSSPYYCFTTKDEDDGKVPPKPTPKKKKRFSVAKYINDFLTHPKVYFVKFLDWFKGLFN